MGSIYVSVRVPMPKEFTDEILARKLEEIDKLTSDEIEHVAEVRGLDDWEEAEVRQQIKRALKVVVAGYKTKSTTSVYTSYFEGGMWIFEVGGDSECDDVMEIFDYAVMLDESGIMLEFNEQYNHATEASMLVQGEPGDGLDQARLDALKWFVKVALGEET